MKKNTILLIGFIVFILFVSIFSIVKNQKEVETHKVAKTVLIIDDNIIENTGNILIEDNNIYLPVKLIKEYLDNSISISKSGKRAIVKLEDKNFKMETQDVTDFIKENNPHINIPLKLKENNKYLRINNIKKIFGIDVSYNESSNTIIIDKKLKDMEYDRKINHTRKQEENKTINITWEYVYEKTPDISDEEKIQGLDVLVPTWFSLSNEGNVINKGDFDYVKDAHEKGYKIWGLVDNSFDPELTSKVIRNEEMKNRVISQIAFYASLYNLDGINIDFENVYYEDKDALVKFVEDLTYILKEQNLIVSIDVTVPGGSKRWSKVYDRERLAKIVDYVALMAYDEHWATSPVSGSVASIGWVEKGIQRSLKSIPKEKLLLGIPFYTRVWEETKGENGKIKVSSKAIPIKNVEEILKKYDAVVTWDEKTGQYFATYEKDNSTYKIWIEDTKSIELKIEMAKKYGLKGIASWRKGYEYDKVWEVINTVVDDKDLL